MLVSSARSHALLLRLIREAIRLAWRPGTSVWQQQNAPQSHLVSKLVQHEPQHALSVVLLDAEVTSDHGLAGVAQVKDMVMHQPLHRCLCGGGRCAGLVDHEAMKGGHKAVVGAKAP